MRWLVVRIMALLLIGSTGFCEDGDWSLLAERAFEARDSGRLVEAARGFLQVAEF